MQVFYGFTVFYGLKFKLEIIDIVLQTNDEHYNKVSREEKESCQSFLVETFRVLQY